MHPSLRQLAVCLALALPAPSLYAALRGVVFDAKGNALSDARVTAHRGETPVAQRARVLAGTARPELGATKSADDGAFSLDGKFGGIVELRVERDGFAPAWQFVLADDEQIFFELTPAPRRTGRVTANGKPVSGALVIAYSESASTIVWTTRSGEEGAYAIPDPKGWCSQLVFVHPDFAPLSQSNTSRLDVALEAGSTISGVVSPVSKAAVFAGRWTTTTTADDGTFTLRHVAAGEKSITAFAGAAYGKGARDPKSVQIRLEPLRSISGTVRDADRRPMEGVPVSAHDTRHIQAPWREANAAVTDAKGNYAILYCDPSTYFVITPDASGLEFEPVTVTLRSNESARADLTATKSTYVTGTVVDEKKRPIANAIVQYSVPQFPLLYGVLGMNGMMPAARSGPDGRFKLQRKTELADSRTALRVQALHRHYAVGVSEPLKSDGKSDARDIAIVLATGIELAGVVTDPEGQPVEGAGVVLLQDPSGAMPMPIEMVMEVGVVQPFAETDAAGRFSVRLNSAPHDLGVWKKDHHGVRMGDILPRDGAEPLKIVLEKGVEIRGRVTSKSTSPSLAGLIVAQRETPSSEVSFSTSPVADDGTFAITGLLPGRYKLHYQGEGGRTAEHPTEAPATDVVLELPASGEIRGRVIDAASRQVLRSYTVEFAQAEETIEGEETFTLHPTPATAELTITAEGYRKGSRQVTVESGKTTEVTIELTRGRTASGVVTDEQGSPIPGAWVASLDSNGSYDSMEQTAENGEFHLQGLQREALTISVSADAHLSRQFPVDAGEQDVRLDVVLSSGRKVRGHVFTAEGAPVDGAMVEASGESDQSATTDASGAFAISGLGDGPYTLEASRAELKSGEVPIGTETPGDVVLVMKPSAGAGSVHGVVRGFAGREWMFGMVRSSEGDVQATIARDGTFRIERAPAGEVELRASARSMQSEATSAPVKVTVIANADVEANLVFRDDTSIRGVVTESGQPATGRSVSFRSGSMRWSTTTREGGSYEIQGIEPGLLYDVDVEGGARSYSTRHQVTGSGTFDIHIEWSRVEGRVLDPAGTPLEGAKVTLVTEGNDDAGSAVTDGSGMFALPVARAAYIISVAKEGFATFTQRVQPEAPPLLVTLTRTDGLRVRLTDARNGRTLDGYVVAVDAAGLPVARADGAQKDGTMLVPLAAGAYQISVSAGGYASQSVRASVPHEGELRLALTPGGTLIVKTDRASADLVKLVLPGGEEYVRCQCNGIAEIRLTGTLTTVDHVAPGTYTMQVLDPQGLVKAGQAVTIVEGQTTEVSILVPE